MPEPSLEKLWKVLQCRDESLGRAHQLVGQQLSQLSEKEQEIQAKEHGIQTKEQEIQRKEQEIQRMASVLIEKENKIQAMASVLNEKENKIQTMASVLIEKEDEIRQLAMVAAERLTALSEQHAQAAVIRERLEVMKRSFEYRFGYVLLNPWQALKKQYLGDSNSR